VEGERGEVVVAAGKVGEEVEVTSPGSCHTRRATALLDSARSQRKRRLRSGFRRPGRGVFGSARGGGGWRKRSNRTEREGAVTAKAYRSIGRTENPKVAAEGGGRASASGTAETAGIADVVADAFAGDVSVVVEPHNPLRRHHSRYCSTDENSFRHTTLLRLSFPFPWFRQFRRRLEDTSRRRSCALIVPTTQTKGSEGRRKGSRVDSAGRAVSGHSGGCRERRDGPGELVGCTARSSCGCRDRREAEVEVEGEEVDSRSSGRIGTSCSSPAAEPCSASFLSAGEAG
jgi:hypothetical protein